MQLARQLTEQVSRLRQRQTAPLILELDLTDGIGEGPVTDPLSAIMSRRKIRLPDVIEGLRRARQDDRVRALVVKVGGGRIGLARMQEIREAVAAFRESGKLTVAWSETFGEFTHGNVPYYLATAFDRIYLQPSGSLGLTGVAVEQLFLHDALAKIGVAFQSAKRYEYKSAADNLTERGFTGPAREANERLAVSIAEQITAAIAERRGKTAEDARALLDRGPFLAADALAEGLVDALGYRDEVYADVRKEAGADAILQYVSRYQRAHALAQRARKLPNPRERFVAVIYASGPIRQGRSSRSPVGGSAMGSDTVAAALRSATSDERVRAVLLRVNSPGGSAVASDTIWREVVRTRAAGKPVVVLDERRGGLRRVLHLDGGRRHRGAAGHADRVDRRDHGQARARGGVRAGRHHHGFGVRGPRGDHVRAHAPVQRGRVAADQRLARRDLPRLHREGGLGPPDDGGADATSSPGDGSGPAPTPRRTAWSTSSAGCRPRPTSPAAGPGCPPTRRCASTPG